jgi:hypothetical protein
MEKKKKLILSLILILGITIGVNIFQKGEEGITSHNIQTITSDGVEIGILFSYSGEYDNKIQDERMRWVIRNGVARILYNSNHDKMRADIYTILNEEDIKIHRILRVI